MEKQYLPLKGSRRYVCMYVCMYILYQYVCMYILRAPPRERERERERREKQKQEEGSKMGERVVEWEKQKQKQKQRRSRRPKPKPWTLWRRWRIRRRSQLEKLPSASLTLAHGTPNTVIPPTSMQATSLSISQKVTSSRFSHSKRPLSFCFPHSLSHSLSSFLFSHLYFYASYIEYRPFSFLLLLFSMSCFIHHFVLFFLAALPTISSILFPLAFSLYCFVYFLCAI